MRTKDACLDGPEVATESSLRGVRTGGSPSRYCAHGLVSYAVSYDGSPVYRMTGTPALKSRAGTCAIATVRSQG